MLSKFVFMIALISFLPVAHAASNEPLTGNELKQATEMNNMYARHMYSSICVEDQKAHYSIGSDTAEQQSAKAAEFKKTCDCVTDKVLDKVAANDVINYVSANRGNLPPGVKKRPQTPQEVRAKYSQINTIEREIRTGNKCGFKKK